MWTSPWGFGALSAGILWVQLLCPLSNTREVMRQDGVLTAKQGWLSWLRALGMWSIPLPLPRGTGPVCSSEEAGTRQGRTPLRSLPMRWQQEEWEGVSVLLKSPTTLLYEKRHHQGLLVHLACSSGREGLCFVTLGSNNVVTTLWFVGGVCLFFPLGVSVTAYTAVTTNSWDCIFQKGTQTMWRSKGGFLSSLLKKTQLQNLRKVSFIYTYPKHHFLAHRSAKKPQHFFRWWCLSSFSDLKLLIE